jgi:HSP20 family protein
MENLVPFAPKGFERLFEPFDQMMENFFKGWPELEPELAKEPEGIGLELEDKTEVVEVKAKAPGFEAGDLKIELRGNMLTLEAAKKDEKKDEKEGREEVKEQKLYGAVTLPAEIDPDKVEAKFVNGLLTVTLPKTEKSKGRLIPITP